MLRDRALGYLLLSLTIGASFAVSGCHGSSSAATGAGTSTGVTVLHDFGSSSGLDGRAPLGDLLLSGSTLYGMTVSGGSSYYGTIFSIGVDGSNYSTLHNFSGSASDGASPFGSLILSGSTLYGMTYGGGSSGLGTVFSIQTNGSGFTILHSFAGGAGDGEYPHASLTLSGSTLYGMTAAGGGSTNCLGNGVTSCGVLFKVGTDGSGYSILHTFMGGTADGGEPQGSLIISGSTLYGMTLEGGAYCVTLGICGTIFSISTNGSGYDILYSFSADASNPNGSLILSGSTLYGMSDGGGAVGRGTVFSIGTDGTPFLILHSFDYVAGDGANPFGSLTLSNGTLYGATTYGGSSNYGSIFEIGTDGSNYSQLGSFNGQNGELSEGSLVFGPGGSSTVYGVTSAGGSYDDGVIFSFSTSGGGG